MNQASWMLIPLSDSNISLIKDVDISPTQAAYEEQIGRHVDCLLNPISGKQVRGFAVKYNENIVGCFRLIVSQDETLCSLSALAISLPYQGQGYGKITIQLIVDYVVENFPLVQFLGLVVNVENETAKRLYKSCDFQYAGPFQEHHEIYRLHFKQM